VLDIGVALSDPLRRHGRKERLANFGLSRYTLTSSASGIDTQSCSSRWGSHLCQTPTRLTISGQVTEATRFLVIELRMFAQWEQHMLETACLEGKGQTIACITSTTDSSTSDSSSTMPDLHRPNASVITTSVAQLLLQFPLQVIGLARLQISSATRTRSSIAALGRCRMSNRSERVW